MMVDVVQSNERMQGVDEVLKRMSDVGYYSVRLLASTIPKHAQRGKNWGHQGSSDWVRAGKTAKIAPSSYFSVKSSRIEIPDLTYE